MLTPHKEKTECDHCCRFNALRELIPHKDKMDKATFLQQAVDYIRQLQVMCCFAPLINALCAAEPFAEKGCSCLCLLLSGHFPSMHLCNFEHILARYVQPHANASS